MKALVVNKIYFGQLLGDFTIVEFSDASYVYCSSLP